MDQDVVEIDQSHHDDNIVIEKIVSECEPEIPQKITVLTGYRSPLIPAQTRLPPARKTIKRNNNDMTALSLPNVWGANHRSLWPRL